MSARLAMDSGVEELVKLFIAVNNVGVEIGFFNVK